MLRLIYSVILVLARHVASEILESTVAAGADSGSNALLRLREDSLDGDAAASLAFPFFALDFNFVILVR